MAKNWKMVRLSNDIVCGLDKVGMSMQMAREIGQKDYELRYDGSFAYNTIVRRLLDEVSGHAARGSRKKPRK